jgi:hypothetical protein
VGDGVEELLGRRRGTQAVPAAALFVLISGSPRIR